MKAIQARLAAIFASFVVATLASWGVEGLSTDSAAVVEKWIAHTFELVLFLGYAVMHPLLQRWLGDKETETARGRRP